MIRSVCDLPPHQLVPMTTVLFHNGALFYSTSLFVIVVVVVLFSFLNEHTIKLRKTFKKWIRYLEKIRKIQFDPYLPDLFIKLTS